MTVAEKSKKTLFSAVEFSLRQIQEGKGDRVSDSYLHYSLNAVIRTCLDNGTLYQRSIELSAVLVEFSADRENPQRQAELAAALTEFGEDP